MGILYRITFCIPAKFCRDDCRQLSLPGGNDIGSSGDPGIYVWFFSPSVHGKTRETSQKSGRNKDKGIAVYPEMILFTG